MRLRRAWCLPLERQIQVVLDREHAIAKAHLATGQKDRAVIALRRRKYQESLLVKTDKQLESLEQLVRPLIFSAVSAIRIVADELGCGGRIRFQQLNSH